MGSESLEDAARSLDGALRETTRFRLIGGRRFDCESLDSWPVEGLTGELVDAGWRVLGDFSLKEVAKTILRVGLFEDAETVGLVISPPEGRAPYAELTTWFTDGGALTTNGRAGELPPGRPKHMVLINRPGMSGTELLGAHRAEVRRRIEAGLEVSPQRGSSGPLHAVARYLDALGF